ncbi:MAG TPA: universal stress protein [Gaiellaceae bacterium]|nr:universal stress protein [Gaiellaceae bacterium]
MATALPADRVRGSALATSSGVGRANASAPADRSRERPVLLATLDVAFDEEAVAFALDSAVETGRPLLVVNAAEVLLTPATLVGYGYVEKEHLQAELGRPAELARDLAVRVERLRVCSPHPLDALLQVVADRRPAVLVFGPDRTRLSARRYRRAARAVAERADCLVWLAPAERL